MVVEKKAGMWHIWHRDVRETGGVACRSSIAGRI